MRSGVDEGGTLVAGGTRFDTGRGFYWSPTPHRRVPQRHEGAREEIFGPVVVAIPFDDEEEGIAIANDSDYGLYDYVWTRDTARGLRVSQRLRAGNVGLNTLARNRRRRSAGSARVALGATVGRSPCTPTSCCRASSGLAEGGDERPSSGPASSRCATTSRCGSPACRGQGAHPPRRALPQRRLGHQRDHPHAAADRPRARGRRGGGGRRRGHRREARRPRRAGHAGQLRPVRRLRSRPADALPEALRLVRHPVHHRQPEVPAFANLGVFSEYTVVHEHQAVVIDPAVPLDAASLIGCAVVTGRCGAQPRQSSPARRSRSSAPAGSVSR